VQNHSRKSKVLLAYSGWRDVDVETLSTVSKAEPPGAARAFLLPKII